MKAIKKLVDRIDEELQDAQAYAEKYVEEKVEGMNDWANNFRMMSEEELGHAMKMHEYTMNKIEKLKQVYTPTQDMLDKWETAHKDYVDRVAWIRQMLAM